MLTSCSTKNYFYTNYKDEFSEGDFEMMVKTIVDTILSGKNFTPQDQTDRNIVHIDTLVIYPDIVWCKFYMYGNDIDDKNSLYPTMNLSLLEMNLNSNRPLLFVRQPGNNMLWDSKKLFCTFYQPVILGDYTVVILMKRWYRGFIGDSIYRFQKKSGMWQMQKFYSTLTHYSAVRYPEELIPELTEERMNEIREKMKNLPTKKIPERK